MRVRDWAGADHYRVLGVAPTATRDEITAAYRAQARVLHPDTGATDPAAEEQFVRIATAYRVLTGPLREEYDRARRRGQVGRPMPSAVRSTTAAAPVPPAAPSRPWQLTRRSAKGALWGGIALLLAGVVAAVVVIALQVRDARLRSNGVPVSAEVIREDGVPRLAFVTRAGEVVVTDLPDAKSGGVTAGDVVDIRYDREHPQRVVTQTHAVARDITLWIVAVKFLVVGAVLTVLGARRLLRHDA